MIATQPPIVVTWRWGTKYGLEYVDRLARGVHRHFYGLHRFVVITDDLSIPYEAWPIEAADRPLTELKGCFARLRMFDPAWQASHGIVPGQRIVCIDLDAIVTGRLDELFESTADFLILQGANASNPCPFNGSLFMLRAGAHADVWQGFSYREACKTRYHEFPDDQGWLWDRLPGAAGWKCGPDSGVYAFKKPGWPAGDELPGGARLVAFPGWRDPSMFAHLPWVARHWC